MKLFTFIILTLGVALHAFSPSTANTVRHSGCVEGSGKEKTEKRSLPSFNAIETEGAFLVNVVCGEKQTVTIRGDDNILPYIKTSVQNDRLVVTSTESICTKRELAVDITMENLKELQILGSDTASVAKIDNKQFVLKIEGSGDVKLAGKTDKCIVTISGSGELEAKNLLAKRVDISIEGSGDADVHASDTLNVSISGAGDVNYWGNPKNVSQDIEGAGDVNRK